MGPKEIYGGWTQTGTRRVWVRVPAALKERSNGSGNGHRANGHRGNGDAAAIVLVHGIGLSGRRVEPLLLALGETRPVYAPDLPGFGLSDAPPFRVLDVPELADGLRRWMIDNGIAPAVLVASASGCQIAIDLAARYPGLVERLVLVGPTMTPEERSLGDLTRERAKRLTPGSIRNAPGAVRDILDAGPIRTIRTLGRALDEPTEQKLSRIEAATLVLGGDDWAERIAAEIPEAELKPIPAGPRASAASAAPALADVVGEFLSADLAAGGPAEAGNDRLIVDGMNVIGSRPDGWWRDRPRAWRELRRELERYAKEHGRDVVLVLDGKRPSGWREDALVETAFAGGGRDAADHAIVARVKADPDPSSLRVVTSDRGLASRVHELGAATLSASSFRAALQRLT
jgi:pimeloyl-ACP methyl ester carboxylesterase